MEAKNLIKQIAEIVGVQFSDNTIEVKDQIILAEDTATPPADSVIETVDEKEKESSKFDELELRIKTLEDAMANLNSNLEM